MTTSTLKNYLNTNWPDEPPYFSFVIFFLIFDKLVLVIIPASASHRQRTAVGKNKSTFPVIYSFSYPNSNEHITKTSIQFGTVTRKLYTYRRFVFIHIDIYTSWFSLRPCYHFGTPVLFLPSQALPPSFYPHSNFIWC